MVSRPTSVCGSLHFRDDCHCLWRKAHPDGPASEEDGPVDEEDGPAGEEDGPLLETPLR